jgi:hypothetical protein
MHVLRIMGAPGTRTQYVTQILKAWLRSRQSSLHPEHGPQYLKELPFHHYNQVSIPRCTSRESANYQSKEFLNKPSSKQGKGVFKGRYTPAKPCITDEWAAWARPCAASRALQPPVQHVLSCSIPLHSVAVLQPSSCASPRFALSEAYSLVVGGLARDAVQVQFTHCFLNVLL